MKVEEAFAGLLMHIPELSSDMQAKTTLRATQAFEFLTRGYGVDLQELTRHSLYPCPGSGPVIVKNIAFISLCEHHLLPMIGRCHVAYLPNDKVLGLSKIPDIIEALSQRLQLQERLTTQIAKTLLDITEGQGAAVHMEAQHLCMAMRGVEKAEQLVVTTCGLGSMADYNPALFL